MAVDLKPSTWFGAGYAASSGSHTITLNTGSAASNKTLPQLLDAKADPTTGDIRQIVLAFAEAMYESWILQGAANQTTQMRLQRSVSGDSSGNITYNFQTSITFTPTGVFSIPAEP